MIRIAETEPPVKQGAKPVVHAPKPVVHAPKRKPGRYLNPDARRAYRAEWMRQHRASKAQAAATR
jgi:hypothetical protein